jgi:hypothetical protein
MLHYLQRKYKMTLSGYCISVLLVIGPRSYSSCSSPSLLYYYYTRIMLLMAPDISLLPSWSLLSKAVFCFQLVFFWLIRIHFESNVFRLCIISETHTLAATKNAIKSGATLSQCFRNFHALYFDKDSQRKVTDETGLALIQHSLKFCNSLLLERHQSVDDSVEWIDLVCYYWVTMVLAMANHVSTLQQQHPITIKNRIILWQMGIAVKK